MELKSQALAANIDTLELNDLIVDSIRDIKGKKIVKLDLRALDDAPTDYFIICEGHSTTQIRSLADHVCRRVKEETGMRPNHMEGMGHSKWILVDYFSTVVHIFYPDTRAFYELEDLWSDAGVTSYEAL